jgi:hypothetical protein
MSLGLKLLLLLALRMASLTLKPLVQALHHRYRYLGV